MAVRVVVLAAGQGSRMKSELPKVLHEVAGRPMLHWVLDAARAAEPTQIVVVVGHEAEQVKASLPDDVEWCLQAEQLGTGHAAQVALDHLGDVSGDTVLILSGDTPHLEGQTVSELVGVRQRTGSAAALLTAVIESPAGYGRIVRDGWDRVVGIVEHKDASNTELTIREINAGIYAFDGDLLAGALADLKNNNSQGEYYLTDVVGAFAGRDLSLNGLKADEEQVAGVNSQDHLARANRAMRRQIAIEWMQRGVWIQDPGSTYISATAQIARGARIYANVHLEGSCVIGERSQVGPDAFLLDATVGRDSRVWYSVVREARVGDNVEVGPYANVRPGTELRDSSKAGSFVEIKNTVVGEGSKVPHLSYIGDATIGTNANIGAGTITCNYDGVNKHATEIGDDAHVGSDTMLVAPVRVGHRAVTGAGSVISKDVADDALGVERSTQREIPGYSARVEARRAEKARRLADEE